MKVRIKRCWGRDDEGEVVRYLSQEYSDAVHAILVRYADPKRINVTMVSAANPEGSEEEQGLFVRSIEALIFWVVNNWPEAVDVELQRRRDAGQERFSN